MSIRIGLTSLLTVTSPKFSLPTKTFCCAAKYNQHQSSSWWISNQKKFESKCAIYRKTFYALHFLCPNAAQFHTNTVLFNDDTTVSENSTNKDVLHNTLNNTDTDISEEQFRTTKGVFTIDELHEHINDVRGEDIFVLHLSKSLLYADYFVVVTATSPRHLMQMAETTNQLYKQRKAESDPYVLIEGKKECDNWMCIDFGNIVVHFMLEEVRNKYQLEKLWLLGPQFDDQFNVAPEESDPLKLLELHSLDLIASDMGHVSVMEGEPLSVMEGEPVEPWDTSYEQSKAQSAEKDPDEDEYVI